MKKVIYNRITITAICYSLAVFIASLCNLIFNGWEGTMSSLYLAELLGVTVVCELIDIILSRLLDNTVVYLAVEAVVMCSFILAVGLWLGWISLSWVNLVTTALLVLVIIGAVYRFSVSRNKADAVEINRQLENNRQS